MTYGLRTYDALGNINFDSTNPQIWLNSNNGGGGATTVATDVSSVEWVFRGSNTPNGSALDLKVVRPRSLIDTTGSPTVSGSYGLEFFGGAAYWDSLNTWKIGSGGAVMRDCGVVTYEAAGDNTGLSDNGGWGLSTWDSNGNMSFTTNPAPPFRGWIQIVGYVGAGTPNSANLVTGIPGVPIYTASSVAEFNNLYVIQSGHTANCLVNYDNVRRQYKVIIACQSYWFRYPTVYACNFKIDTGWFDQGTGDWDDNGAPNKVTGPWGTLSKDVVKTLPSSSSITVFGTLANNYMVGRVVPYIN